MHTVIYADVLVVTNVYITYFLLRATALLSRTECNRLRLFLASFLGGAYSLTVLLPEKVQGALLAVRLLAALVFIFVAFGYSSLKAFLRLNVSFFSCSFIFAGLMFALWYFISPGGMYFNGAVVYFDINILSLVVMTVICYVFIKLFDRIFKSRAPVNTVFSCTVVYNEHEFVLRSFLDTGNNLRDYFTGRPVIIADRRAFSDIFPEKITVNGEFSKQKVRFIFCNTLVGKGFLPAFSPTMLKIKGTDYNFSTEEITVALTEEKLLQGEYDAILPMGLFENNFDRKDERESEKDSVNA